MAANYVAKYGDTIRRLAALDLAAQGNSNLAGAGPQPRTSPFDAGAPVQSYDPALGDGQGEGPQIPAALDSPKPRPEGPKVSPRSLWEGMSTKEQKEVIKQVESKGIDIDEKYDEAVAAGKITPPAKALQKGEKLTVLAETLLRFSQNIGGGMEGGAAASTAILDTQFRRGGLERQAAEQEAAMKEKLRLEGREDTATATKRAEALADTESERTYKDKDREDAQAAARDLQAAQDRAAKDREKGKNSQVAQLEDGTYIVIDKDKEGVVEVEQEETATSRGQRGRPGATTTKKVKKPAKGPPKANASGFDQDRIAQIKLDVEKLARSDEVMRELKKEAKARNVSVETVVKEYVATKVQNILSGADSSGADPLELGLE
jgi:hypothetical protein